MHITVLALCAKMQQGGTLFSHTHQLLHPGRPGVINACLISHYFTVKHWVSEGTLLSTLPSLSSFVLRFLSYTRSPLFFSHTHTQSQCHSQLKDDSPVGEEEEVCEASPVHPYKDVRVVGDLQLHQKWNIPERQTHNISPVLSFHYLRDAGLRRRLHNSLIFVIHHIDLQVRDCLQRVHQLEWKKWQTDWQCLYKPFPPFSLCRKL